MERKILTLLGILAVGILVAITSARAEEATNEAAQKAFENGDPDNIDPVSIQGEHWNLDITYEEPLPIIVLNSKGEKAVYWYMIYTITNNTGADRQYVPSFILFTDSGQVDPAAVNPDAFAAVKKLRGIKYPTLENACQMVAINAPADNPDIKKPENTTIKMGPDNARTGVAIFAPLERNARRFSVFIQGLSGEYVERPVRPNKIEPGHLEAGDKLLRLHKTFAMNFELPGDQWWQNMDKPIFKSKKWTWR
jgi:hypothetical protein